MEYDEKTIEIARQLAIRPEPPLDSDILMKVLQKRVLEGYGFNLQNFTLEEVCIKLCKMIDELKGQIGNMQAQIELSNQKKLTPKQLISALIIPDYHLPLELG